MNNKIKDTPFFGYYKPNFKKFVDIKLFDSKHSNYIKLRKVKIWYGFSDNDLSSVIDSVVNENILGIQCEYLNSITGEIKSSEMNCGNIKDANIITKVLDLTSGDYINKFVICFTNIISYIKLETKSKKCLEAGQFNQNFAKTLAFNSDTSKQHMITSFYGYFNELGLRALGCHYVNRNEYVIFNSIDYFRYRHIIDNNEEEKRKWTEDKIKTLNYDERAFIRICLLPKFLFFKMISYI